MTQEALKLALEALIGLSIKHGEMTDAGMDAITAIKEALAQEKTLQALHSENERLGLYKDAYAQPEPVAWMYQEYRDDDQFGWRDEILFTPPPNDPIYFRNITPVYTIPQRTWVGLTSDEIANMFDDWPFKAEEFARAIEAKLKEKNT